MRMVDIIEKKRDGGKLTKEEIEFFVNGYVRGDIPDYQASALLMAIYFRNMDYDETLNLTLAMENSGDKLDLSDINGIKVDKHSTGGVGDKTSLVLAPMVAALGGKVAKMSGRGLGHTGGTIDKLESIPGFNTSLSEEAFVKQVNDIGIAITGQTGNLAPADKKLYALRDVTATVENISLIASSIMSKKLAAGADAIVVSNHGGRVLDQCPATAEVLEEIAKAVKGKMKIFVDGGIRSGVDVFKALALGADGVIICRPFVTAAYGGGTDGVQLYIERIGSELADMMAMCGANSLKEITKDMIWR